MKTLLVFNIKNSSVVCKFLNSLLTLSLSRLADPERRHDLQLYPLKSHSIYQNIKEKILYGFLFSIAAAFYSAQLSYDVVCHHRNDLTKQCTVQCSSAAQSFEGNNQILRFITTGATTVCVEESRCLFI